MMENTTIISRKSPSKKRKTTSRKTTATTVTMTTTAVASTAAAATAAATATTTTPAATAATTAACTTPAAVDDSISSAVTPISSLVLSEKVATEMKTQVQNAIQARKLFFQTTKDELLKRISDQIVESYNDFDEDQCIIYVNKQEMNSLGQDPNEVETVLRAVADLHDTRLLELEDENDFDKACARGQFTFRFKKWQFAFPNVNN